MAAADLGVDRVEFRRRNLISEAEMPYPLAKVAVLDIESETDSGDYRATLDRCLDEIGWTAKAALQGRLIDGRYHGVGDRLLFRGRRLGTARECPPGAGDRRLGLGPCRLVVGRPGAGDGIRPDRRRRAGDADRAHPRRVPRLDRSPRRGLRLVQLALGSDGRLGDRGGGGEAARRDPRRGGAAARLRHAKRSRSSTAPRSARARQSIALGALGGIAADGTYASNKRTYSYGAHAAHVAVDPKTGLVEVLDYVAVEDVGRIINPATLHGQAVGAIVQGLGGAFLEHLVYDEDGQLLTGSLADYLMPTASDYPSVRAVALELKPAPHNPLGAKGAGEGGVIPVGGVVANAVANALSAFAVEPRDLPLSPPRVWQLIHDAQPCTAPR